MNAARLPLSPHCNPIPVSFRNSLEVFPNGLNLSYPLLQRCFHDAIPRADPAGAVRWLLTNPTNSLKAGYAAHSIREGVWLTQTVLTAKQVLPRAVTAYTWCGHGLPQSRASTEKGRGLPCHWQTPLNLNSQHPPRTGIRSRDTRNFIDVPFSGFLGPPSDKSESTKDTAPLS